MIKWFDDQLNRITMYRLVLYYLIGLLVIALLFSFAGVLAYDPYALLFSTAFILAASAITNWAFSRVYGVPVNVESTTISALILALIITPIHSYNDLWFLLWASVLAMASKYILAVRGKHLFNPVAIAVALTYFAANQSASWWIGDARLLPFVLVGGLLIARKLRRFDLVLSFFVTAFAVVLLASLFSGTDPFAAIQKLMLYSPLAFFAFTMLTEPLTTPPTRKLRLYYGALTAFLFTPVLHLGTFYTTPELALLIGNVFSYIVSPKAKLILRLKARKQLSPDTYEFVFTPPRQFAFAPGQYMEWTLGHADPDSRGNRRFFTLASAPTERDLKLGVKFNPHSSSFKQAMLALDNQQDIVATQLAGDFVLPDDPRQKIALIAGGIGVTPFRSMIQYLLDTHQRRPIILFYVNHNAEDILYKDVFDRAERELGIKTLYTVTDGSSIPTGWPVKVGRITAEGLRRTLPGYHSFHFYISGSPEMVDSFKALLRQIGVKPSHIKTDFFSGL